MAKRRLAILLPKKLGVPIPKAIPLATKKHAEMKLQYFLSE